MEIKHKFLKKLPNLDPLRFFLAALVIIYHLPSLSKNQGLPYFNDFPIFSKGGEAVYTFFVLSGFLIIRSIYLQKKNNSFSIRKFYFRRILRIIPIYYLIIIFGFLFYQVILPFLEIPFDNNYNLIEGLGLTLLFFSNVFAFKYEPGGILEILWSIGVEAQFYIIIAPLLFYIRETNVLFVLIVIAILYLGIYHLPSFAYLRTYLFVFFYLFAGGIVAILEENKKLEILKKSIVFPALVSVATLLYFFTNVFKFETLVMENMISVVVLSFFIHTISCNNFGYCITNRIINYLGKISYGIYMFHVIALNAVVFLFLRIKEFSIFNDTITIILINILTFALTIFMAHFSYQFYEKSFLKLKNKYR